MKVPEDARVAVIIGRPEQAPPESEFFKLAHLPGDKRRIIDDFFANVRNSTNVELGAGFLARLVLGEKLPDRSVKWTKDLRLLLGNTRNASIKRT
ncbi:hypothetical protein [Aquincola sp. J276]|uniref:hypothetical protein n=1 Tax=Aquincola sp. J276 TaxID=2898432 RepID=UPI0021516AC4|nr:hypothetical protein [Aquincola sp. J276]MCR5868200.1 hypothetical protein [Aquincola sp. J276]